MIYFARLSALIGGVMTLASVCAIAIIILFEPFSQEIIDQNLLSFAIFTAIGCFLLILGQMSGNDLFVLRGRDSILSIKPSNGRDSSSGGTHGGGDWFGGDCGDGGD